MIAGIRRSSEQQYPSSRLAAKAFISPRYYRNLARTLSHQWNILERKLLQEYYLPRQKVVASSARIAKTLTQQLASAAISLTSPEHHRTKIHLRQDMFVGNGSGNSIIRLTRIQSQQWKTYQKTSVVDRMSKLRLRKHVHDHNRLRNYLLGLPRLIIK